MAFTLATEKTKVKLAIVLRDYEIDIFGHELTIPAGTYVTNKTAAGADDNYRFWCSYHQALNEQLGQDWRQRIPLLAIDLAVRGVNVPAEYCSDWHQPTGY